MKGKAILAVLIVSCVFATGCASISSKKKHTLIESTPEQAQCEVTGKNYKQRIATPATLDIPVNAAPVDVRCEKEGYFSVSERIDTKMDGMIVGNILMGGLIGLAIDAGTGAGQQYPEKLSLILDKNAFASEAERNEWYDKREKNINSSFDLEAQAINAGCRDEDRSMCERKVRSLNEIRTTKLQDLQRNREQATIIPPPPPVPEPVVSPPTKKKSRK